jgi:PAS domain S-box-containing protein
MAENSNYGNYSISTFLNSTTKIVASTAILYFLIAKLSLFVFVTEINILPFFPAMGFAIAALLVLGRKAILGVTIGCLLFSISLYKDDFQNATTFEELIKPLALCIVRPIITGLNTFLVSYLSQLWCKKKYPFDSKKNVIFFAFASLLGTFISVSIGFIPLVMTPYFSLDTCILIWSNMLRGNALGIIIFTPFMLSWLSGIKEFSSWSSAKKAEVFLLIISTLSLSLCIFESHANNESILFFLLIWAACRFGMKIITLVVIIITVIAIYCTGHHMGGFVFSGWNKDFLMLQLFLFVNMVSVLFLKAILEEKETEENKLKISEKDLSLEKNILKATIESPKGISISSLDTNLNYLSFNSAHARYMKNVNNAEIQLGKNHLEYIIDVNRKEEINSIFQNVLRGNLFSVEEKDGEGEYWNITKSPIKNSDEEIIGVTTIVTNITELKSKEIQLGKNNLVLNEKLKELDCLYTISETFRNKKLSKSEKLQVCVDIIPKGMQFPKIANCRIQFKGKEFISANYHKSEAFLNKSITINGEDIGCVELGYFDAERELNENFFTKDEAKLFEALTNIISKAIETKIAEENLKISEEKFRSIYENSLDIYFKKNLEGVILEIGPSVEKHLHQKRESMIGKNIRDYYYDITDADRFYEIILKEHQINDYQEQFITSAGDSVYLSVNAKLIYDADGNPIYVEGTRRNISERILNEKHLLEATEKIKESEEKFRSIYENMQDVYYMHNLDGRIFEISPSCEKHFKYTSEEMIGIYTGDLYYEPTKQDELRKKIIRDGLINDEHVQFVTATGEPVYFSVNCKIIFDSDGIPSHVEGSMRNINERITNQQKLITASEKIKESEEKFRSIYENMQDVYFMHELGGTLLDISPSVEKNFLSKRENLIGLNVKNFYSAPARYDELAEKILNEGFLNDQEVQFLTTTGETVYFSVSARLINDRNNNRILVEGTMRNVNERISNQKQLLKASVKIKESEEKFRSIYENMLDVYYLQKLDGTILDVSPSAEKAFQIKREDLIGLNARSLQSDPARYDKNMVKLNEEGFLNDQEVQFVTTSGETVYFSVNARLIYNCDHNCTLVEGTMRNINERIVNQNKLLEATEKIKQSEEEFRAIFESFEDVYIRSSLDGRILNISPSVEKILKYKREEIINNYASVFYLNPEDRSIIYNILNEKGHINDWETIFKDKDSNPVYVSVSAHFVYDSDGNALYTEATIRDICQRKKNELEIETANQVIRESEKKYRTIFESVRDVFFRASAIDHSILDISPSCTYFDVQPEDIVGKTIDSFYLNPEDRQVVLKELTQNGEIKNYDAKFLVNSKIYNVSINSKIVFDQNNNPEFVIGSFRDITARIHAEEKLKISEAKFRSIYENFEDIYFKSELDTTIIDLSPSFEKHFKMKRSDAIGNSTAFLYCNPEDRETIIGLLKKNRYISDFDTRYLDGEGNIVSFSINARIVCDSKGEPLFVEGTMRNINERSIMQEEMLAKNRTLEFQNVELEQFAYIASHDLQEPLITVIHCIELLQEGLHEDLDDEKKQYLEFINSSTSRMQQLVKGLLDYSRIGKGRKNSSIDCNEIVSNVLSDMNASLKESNAVVEYENLPVIEGYSTEIRQLFQNVISNANKYRKKDQQPKIKIAAVKEETNWIFSIEDNGIGIKEEDMDKVFVIFKRLHNRNEYQGTGIGLSHCKKIVEHHKGRIWVESTYNEGSTFKWTFPIEPN